MSLEINNKYLSGFTMLARTTPGPVRWTQAETVDHHDPVPGTQDSVDQDLRGHVWLHHPLVS